MGWKGNFRTGIAIARRIERAEKRKASNAARQYKAMLKQEAFNNGQRIVQEYDDYIELISSTHKDTSESIDWHGILNEAPPEKPTLTNKNLKLAEINLNNFKPSFFDNLFGSTNKKIRNLEQQVEVAKIEDKQQFEKELNQYSKDLSEWTKNQELAKGVLSLDPTAYRNVIEYLDPFSDIKEIGSGLNLSFNKNHIVVNLAANGVTVIPDFVLTQTASGKVSKKKMPIGKFNELYQDYICGCVLRVAREIFSFLPIEFVFVNALSELVNSSTGHLEQQTILSVVIPKLTFERLNFETLDPSDAMKNFKHNMKFSKTTGFSIVSNISIDELNIANFGSS